MDNITIATATPTAPPVAMSAYRDVHARVSASPAVWAGFGGLAEEHTPAGFARKLVPAADGVTPLGLPAWSPPV